MKFRLDIDRSAMAFDNSVDDSETESRSFSVFFRREKRLKNVRQCIIRNPYPGVGDGNVDCVGGCGMMRLHFQRSTLRA